MSANTNPIFTLTPTVAIGQISAANALRDGAGTIVTVLSAGANGTRVNRVVIKATVTTTAGTVRLFIGNGSGIYLWKEILVTAITASATVAAFEYIVDLPGESSLVLPSGSSIRASTEKAEAFNIIVEGGDF